MRDESSHDRLLVKLRTQFWDSLPTKASRIRRIARRQREGHLDLGEFEELELTVKRMADSAQALGFHDVSEVACSLANLLVEQRAGKDVWSKFDDQCDRLDQLIDDMTLEALAVGLRSLWQA